jgi:hypothetical protein
MKARASRAMAAAVADQSERLKLMAVVMGKAKLVDAGVDPELLT